MLKKDVPDQFAQAHIRLSPLLTHPVRPTRYGGLRAHYISIQAQFAPLTKLPHVKHAFNHDQ
jgi:hypothetical protein